MQLTKVLFVSLGLMTFLPVLAQPAQDSGSVAAEKVACYISVNNKAVGGSWIADAGYAGTSFAATEPFLEIPLSQTDGQTGLMVVEFDPLITIPGVAGEFYANIRVDLPNPSNPTQNFGLNFNHEYTPTESSLERFTVDDVSSKGPDFFPIADKKFEASLAFYSISSELGLGTKTTAAIDCAIVPNSPPANPGKYLH